MPNPAADPRPTCYHCGGFTYRQDDDWHCVNCGRDQAQPLTPLPEVRRDAEPGRKPNGPRHNGTPLR